MTTRTLLILTGCLVITGCGITDPYQSTAAHPAQTPRPPQSTTTTRTAADAADPAPERGGTIPAAAQRAQRTLTTSAGAATPQAALRRYAQLDTNWQAATLADRQRQLAAMSVDQARTAALHAAAGVARDTELTDSHVSNRGQMIAIAPGTGPARGQWVIVTTETTSGTGDYTGLPAAVHVTYAHVTHTPTGWVVSQWSPQN